MKDSYTTALLELLSTTDDVSKVLKGFKATLERKGHDRLFVPVLQAVLRVLESKRATTTVAIRSEADKEKFAKEIEATLKELGATTDPEFITDETMIGGYVAEHNHVRVDKSYKSKLVSLYRNLTK